MGGIVKEKSFKNLFKYKKNLVKIYLYGQSSYYIHNQVKNFSESIILPNLSEVIDEIYKDIKLQKYKSVILFSPACSSFDQYKNFEERGLDFNKLIKRKFIN